jgi:DedD protein
MDRRVKERLIGASILVALIVWVVPELLSGPKPAAPALLRPPAIAPEPIRNVTVDLATSKAPAESSAEPAAIPAPAPPAPSTATAGEVGNSTSPSPAPAPVERPATSPISASGTSWAVQLGSFANRANADNLVHQLKAQGMSVFVLSGGSGQALRYRVRIGPLANREEADRLAAKLKSLGRVSSIIAPGT